MNRIANANIPTGYREDAQGRLVAESNIKPIDLMRDALVTSIVERAIPLSRDLAAFKIDSFAEIETFIDRSARKYRVRVGGHKGNVTLLSFNGRYKVQRAVADRICFDERLQAAKELIEACLLEWTADARDELRTLVQDAFNVDRQGNIQVGRVLALRRHQIKDPRWLRAMAAIGDAVQVLETKSYIRVYERDDDTGDYKAIPLGVSGS